MQAERGKDELDPLEFDDLVREKMKLLEMDPEFLDRSVNEGFSGGEKKRNEILQMALLEPTLAILDETDSGLDIDALRIVAERRQPRCAGTDNAIVLVTHYQRLLNYIVPDYVHVMDGGRIVKTGGKELALELEERGYDGDRGRRRPMPRRPQRERVRERRQHRRPAAARQRCWPARRRCRRRSRSSQAGRG